MTKNTKPIIPSKFVHTWAKMCSDIENKQAGRFSEILGTQAATLVFAYHLTHSIEKSEKLAGIPARSGRAVLDCILHAMTAHYANTLMIIE